VGKKSEYEIKFVSLQDGTHKFEFKIDGTFFEQFDYADIEGADLKLDVKLEKKPNMMIVDFDIEGKIKVMCDRCTDSFYYAVKGNDDVIYKFGEEQLDDEKVITVLPNEIEIDLSMPIFEFASLLLPSRRIHPEGKCNEEMLKEIDNYLIVEEKEIEMETEEEEEIDPRWAKLKKLK